jgi:L-cysteine:1D-myo-inositol 2-amino-2-deoxy-alpha-D-glucopyranoside ligase
LQLFNSMGRKLEEFVPSGDVVGVYACGITPYDTTHLGHAFTYLTADVLIRYLEFKGYAVRYVQNVTDIDDDILRKAKQVGEDWRTLVNHWTAHFIEDMMALNVRAPDVFPRATEAIPQIVEIVARLLDAGVAYRGDGNVYFHIDAWPEYGKLSRLPRVEMLTLANERGNNPQDPCKQDPLDFVLWQAQAPQEPGWSSPWGVGRPGWHIECSTLAQKFLGQSVDIHMGGADLIFPHHESEIAQVEPASGVKPFVRYWMHVAMVYHEGEKMSKSLGNLVMVRDLLRQYSADALRIYLAGHHYRTTWSYDAEELRQAAQVADELRRAACAISEKGPQLDVEEEEAAFMRAMDADLDTPQALSALERIGKAILAGEGGRDVRVAQQKLRSLGGIFGLRLDVEGAAAGGEDAWRRHLAHFAGETGA